MNIKKLEQLLNQYGYTPKKIQSRLTKIDAPKVVANSIPKAGTNLLIRALYLLHPMHRALMRTVSSSDNKKTKIQLSKLKRGQFLVAHLKYDDELYGYISNEVKNIIMIRDPRDMAVSNYIYITYKDFNHRLNKYYNSLDDDNQRLVASVKGVDGKLLPDGQTSLSLSEHLKGYMGWLDKENCMVVRFEDLVGEKGGGNNEIQLKTYKKIVKYLGLDIEDKELEGNVSKIFNPGSRTFVKGQIGTWRNILDDEHKEMIKEELNEVLISLGYESDDRW